MNDIRYRIPQLQPLPASTLFRGKSDVSEHYPFSSSQVAWYYLARNAIWHGIDSLGLKPGDEVIMPAYHHGIEVETLTRRGLKLVYYRIDERMQIDFDHLESLINPGSRALYCIHYGGFPQPVDRLKILAEQNRLKFIEDCALALFSASHEGPLGTGGDISIFCLYKTLPLPHGGLLVINDEQYKSPSPAQSPDLLSTSTILANRLLDSLDTKWNGIGYRLNNSLKSVARKIKRNVPRDHVPIDTEDLVEEHLSLGVSPVTRYIVNRQDKHFIVERRRENYQYLVSQLQGSVEIPFPDLAEGVCPLFLPIVVDDKTGTHNELVSRGVESVKFWSRNHPDVPSHRFPEVNWLRDHILEIPIHQGLQLKDMDYIARIVKAVI